MLLLLLRKKQVSSFTQLYVLKCKFEFSIFRVFAGIEPATSGPTVPCSDQLS